MSNKINIFRTAAILYADQNYNVSTKLIIRKLVESVLLNASEESLTIDEIINYCSKYNYLDFDYEEIKNIVTKGNEDCFDIFYIKNGEIDVKLKNTRRKLLEEKVSTYSIDNFIEEYIRLHTDKSSKLHELLYAFLYYTINFHQDAFLKLLNTKSKVDISELPKEAQFSIDDRHLINDFLNWDNDGKNKALFDIVSFSIEFCLLVSNNRDSIHLNILKNKIFYLDANILYRVIGVNGFNRQKRTITFLRKCEEIGIKIIISKFTEREFVDSIKYSINKMKEYGGNKVDPEIFSRYADNFDIYDFYYHWRKNRTDANFIAFQHHILSLYEEFKKRYHVNIDYKIPFSKDEGQLEIIKGYAQSLMQYKEADEGNLLEGPC